MTLPLPSVFQWRFTRLRTRLAVLYGLLFAVCLLFVAVVGQVVIWTNARETVGAELKASGSVYDRIWALRARSLADAASVLTRDFGFRSAIASGDTPTIESALTNLGARADVSQTFFVDISGKVIGGGRADLRRTVAKVPGMLTGDRRDAVIATNKGVVRLIVAPVLAPNEIGWVIFALPLDQREMTALQHLSAIPLTATMLYRHSNGHWLGVDGMEQGDQALDAFVTRAIGGDGNAGALLLPVGYTSALAKPLAGPTGKPTAVLLLSYPWMAAMAGYRAMQIGIALAGVMGLVLVLLGSRRLASGIARPIAALDAAARALEEGNPDRIGRTKRGRGRSACAEFQPDVGRDHRARAPHHASRVP